jgi:FkbM family methyltransferase
MRIRRFFTFIVQALSRSPYLVRQALFVRDACNAVIRERLRDGIDPERNGEAWLASVEAQRAAMFIDVGANVGDWADLFLQSMPEGGRGLLFDPSSTAAERLRHRFQEIPGIEVVPAAVSQKIGEAAFFEEPGAGMTSSLVPGSSRRSTAERLVRVTTLDLEADRRGLDYIDFVKVDAEGHDLHVLQGASKLLSERRIGVVQFEYHKTWAATTSTLGAAYDLLGSCGYRVFLLKSEGLFALDYERYREYFGYSNFVGVAPERVPDLEPAVRGTV